MVSKNYLRADSVNILINLIQEYAKESSVFFPLLEKMCMQEIPWSIDELKERFIERKSLPGHLLKCDTKLSGETVYVWRVNISPSGYLYSNKVPKMQNRLLR
jgi:hypothetical protein